MTQGNKLTEQEVFGDIDIIQEFPRYTIGYGKKGNEHDWDIFSDCKKEVMDRINFIKDDLQYYIENWSFGDNIIVYLERSDDDITPIYTIYEKPKKILTKEEFRKTGKHPGEFLACFNSKYCS